MVINRNPRKAICFWRVCGEQQEHQFPNFIPWQIWITWDCLQLGWLRLLWITFPYPLFVFFGKVIPIHTSLLSFGCPTFIVSLSIFYPSRCVRSHGLSLGLGSAMGICHEVRRTQPSCISECKDLLAMDTSPKDFPCSFLETALSPYPTLQKLAF